MSTTAVVSRIFVVTGFVLGVACLGVGYIFNVLFIGLGAGLLAVVVLTGFGLLLSHVDKRNKKRAADLAAYHVANHRLYATYGPQVGSSHDDGYYAAQVVPADAETQEPQGSAVKPWGA